jgi:hypothetical protein
MGKKKCSEKKHKTVKKPKFQCEKCSEIAKKKKHICKPEKIS